MKIAERIKQLDERLTKAEMRLAAVQRRVKGVAVLPNRCFPLPFSAGEGARCGGRMRRESEGAHGHGKRKPKRYEP